MAIASTDLLYTYSTATGPGNSTAGAAGTSLGGYISTTTITDATANNVFDDITGTENATGVVDYRCIFVHNSHATLTLSTAVAWLAAEVSGGAVIALAVDDIAASAIGSASPQAATIATETTTPTGVGTFAAPVSKATGLALGNLGPGQCRALWVRRTATNSAALTGDGVTVRVEGDSPA